jgi:hypothetical protein
MNESLIVTKPEDRQLAATAVATLDRCAPAMAIWQKSHSDFMWQAMTIGGEHAPHRRLRQVAAELQRKQDALTEATFEVRRRLVAAKVKRELAQGANGAAREMLLLEAEECEAKAEMVRRPYLGALRDVVELGRLHDALVAQVGDLSIANIERQEARYWVARALRQSLRDVREHGGISKGEQELLEHLGMNPLAVEEMLVAWAEKERVSADLSSFALDEFIEQSADQFCHLPASRAARLGLDQPSEH